MSVLELCVWGWGSWWWCCCQWWCCKNFYTFTCCMIQCICVLSVLLICSYCKNPVHRSCSLRIYVHMRKYIQHINILLEVLQSISFLLLWYHIIRVRYGTFLFSLIAKRFRQSSFLRQSNSTRADYSGGYIFMFSRYSTYKTHEENTIRCVGTVEGCRNSLCKTVL